MASDTQSSDKNGVNTLDQEPAFAGDALSGTRVGPYEVLGPLIRGEARTLLGFRTEAPDLGFVVVLRQVDPNRVRDPRVKGDAARAASLSDPRLERVFGIEVTDEAAYWVSEYVQGATLAEIRAACEREGRPLPLGLSLAALSDAALGIQVIHAGAASHGLLRPQNIVVTLTGAAKALYPRYLGYPAGASVDDAPLDGNAGYLSPEAINGQPPDPRSDVFSLAVLAYESITGQLLFRGRTPRQRADAALRGDIPPASRLNLSVDQKVDQVLAKALNPNPAARYPNAAEFLKAFKLVGSAFMWREAQRADFLASLFPVRIRQLKGLPAEVQRRIAAAEAARAAAEAKAAEEARAFAEAQAAAAAAEERERLEREARAKAEAAMPEVTPVVGGPGATGVRSAQRPAATLPRWIPFAFGGGGLAIVVLIVVAVVLVRSRNQPPPVVVAPPPVVAPVADASVAQSDGGTEDGGVEDGGADGGESDGGAADAGKPKKKHTGTPVPSWLR